MDFDGDIDGDIIGSGILPGWVDKILFHDTDDTLHGYAKLCLAAKNGSIYGCVGK